MILVLFTAKSEDSFKALVQGLKLFLPHVRNSSLDRTREINFLLLPDT